jgi:hypothetical protein
MLAIRKITSVARTAIMTVIPSRETTNRSMTCSQRRWGASVGDDGTGSLLMIIEPSLLPLFAFAIFRLLDRSKL